MEASSAPMRPSLEAISSESVDKASGDAIVRKVGRRLMWYVIGLYIVSVLDRGNLGFASFSMNKELGLTPQMYGIGVGILFLGYSLFEVPSNLALARYGARITLTRIAMLFGLVTMSMAFVTGPHSFYVVRGLLGMAEAGLTPGVFLFLSYWIPQSYRARYNAAFTYAVPSAYILASLVSGAILQLDGALGVPGWKWLFVLEGLPAVLLGVIGIFYLTDRPHQAKWLSPTEREWLQAQIDRETTVQHEKSAKLGQLLRRPVLWILAIGYIGIFCGNATLGIWLPQIMHGHGVNLSVIGFVSAVPPLAGVVGMTYLSRRSDKMDERVWHTVACMLLAAAGFGMVATSHSAATALVGFMLANIGVYSSLAIFWSIPQTYLSAKVRPAAIALISSFGALFGGWLAPIYIGKAQGYFHSLPMGMAIVAALMLVSSLCVGGAGARLARA